MTKIAVMGGTFNPVHNGHLHMAEQFAKLIGASLVLFIPTASPPHKNSHELASAEDRLAMCRLACEGRFEVSDLEIRRGGLSYTSDTLRSLKKTYPDSELYFITGEDMFLTLEQWHEPEVILSLATVCAAPRSWEGCGALEACAERMRKHGGKVLLADIDYLPISSTAVRIAVKSGMPIGEFVPPKIAEYIRSHHLYME